MTGKTAVVTGSTSGIGFETAKMLASRGARVVLACRDPEAMHAAADRIRTQVETAEVVEVVLDLADLSSVSAAADRVCGQFACVDLLINNAGVMALRQQRLTADGFEMQLAVNHLGHFAFTGLLLVRLAASRAARVVTVSSKVHPRGRIGIEDLPVPPRYDPWAAYAASKLANVLFASELNRRLSAAGLRVISLACHPGFSSTNLSRELVSSRIGTTLLGMLKKITTQPAARGALPTLCAATAPDMQGGEYIGPTRMGHTRGPAGLDRMKGDSSDRDLARGLWSRSEELTNVRYTFDAAASVPVAS
ncbi:oxidoreductase [Dactylosporangium darangshiense]|uniref:Oxidoreductase n=1 Tax=Dactylosporangium darangshiense TaxID=579108 RepID=A0ABP8DU42_9ACTN